uniref:C2H2-type domain-containing protein n=1 Tax=Bursaphelenchus xylophilus TaxID=6326 RepID=A0A1I7S1Y1_BURXY
MQNETISQLDRNFEILSAGLAIFLAFMFFYFVSVGVLYFYLALVYPQRNRKAPDQDDSSLKRTERRAKPAENFIEFKKATYQAVFDCPREHCDTHSLSASTEYASKHREMSRKVGKFVKKGLKVEKDQISKKNSAEKAGNQLDIHLPARSLRFAACNSREMTWRRIYHASSHRGGRNPVSTRNALRTWALKIAAGLMQEFRWNKEDIFGG